MKNKYLYILALSIFSLSCQREKVEEKSSKSHHNLQAVVWQQNAAEYRALCLQAYNLAFDRLKSLEDSLDAEMNYAIITDIDETVLDNSNYNARLIRDKEEYKRETWDEWVNEENADLIPGAYEFFNAVNEMGMDIFYISNRYESTIDATISNLQKWDLPNADSAHVFLKTETSAKQSRRNKVLKDYKVLLYMGDNLSDLHELFDDKTKAERNSLVEDMKSEFGRNFIIFPNVIYGDWESDGVFNGKYDWTQEEMDSIRKSNLKY